MIQAPVSKPTLVKSWDEKRGRMVILLKNGDMPLRDVTVEDAYPSTIAGVLCFAKVGGVAPMATASDGKDRMEDRQPAAGRGEGASVYCAH